MHCAEAMHDVFKERRRIVDIFVDGAAAAKVKQRVLEEAQCAGVALHLDMSQKHMVGTWSHRVVQAASVLEIHVLTCAIEMFALRNCCSLNPQVGNDM